MMGNELINRAGPARRRGLAWLFAGLLAGTVVPTTGQVPSLYVPPTASAQRQYAPDREIDILHLLIDVTPDFKQRTVAGHVTLRFKPIAKPFSELKLDGIDLQVQSVSATEKVMGWQATDEKVIVTFEHPIPPDAEASVTIVYRAEPKRGLYFRTPEMGYLAEDIHLFTQGEAILARHWYPCYDAPNERFTSEMICHVPTSMTVLSNGRLVSETPAGADGLKAVRWAQEKPHVNYLISLLAGNFRKLKDKYRDIPLAFWTLPSAFAHAQSSFKDTRDMMAFFEEEIGVPYPWAKYDQVCVQDFVAGGMENTSITTMKEETLHPEGFEPLRSSQGLVAHELAHQWFGDLVTCKDWSHLWLNEGFATYYEHLYSGHKDGPDHLRYRLLLGAKSIINHPNQTNAIVRRDFSEPGEQFNHLNYGKGAWVLHMLRCQLGEELYRRCIRTYLERHQYQNVVTEDLNKAIEELSGRSFDRFFDQWVYHASQPELSMAYAWNEAAKEARVSVRQIQKISDGVLLFETPLPVRFKFADGTTADRQIVVRQATEDFYFTLPRAPKTVRIDPEVTVLAKIDFKVSATMLQAQLEDKNDMPGRLLAVEKLGEQRERGAVDNLKRVLQNDSFYGVRIAASQALRAIGTDQAFEALRDCLEQPDARVRRQVVADLGGFYRKASCATLLKIVETEKHPDIQAAAIRVLGAYPEQNVREKLLGYLESSSFRNVLADAAIAAIRAQDDPSYLTPLLECLRQRQRDFSASDFGQALDAVAWLARAQTDKKAVREFLLSHVNSPRERVQLAALSALGTLGDPKAVAALETFAGDSSQSRQAKNARRAIEQIRADQKPSVELRSLRKEVLDLKEQNRALEKEMGELKRRIEKLAAPPKTAADAQPEPAKPAQRTKPPGGW